MRSNKFEKLNREMRKRGLDRKALCQKLCLCQQAISNRFTGRTAWRLYEAYAVLDWLEIPRERLNEYFPCINE